MKFGGSASFRVSGGVVGRLGFRVGVSTSYSYFRRVRNFDIVYTAAVYYFKARRLLKPLSKIIHGKNTNIQIQNNERHFMIMHWKMRTISSAIEHQTEQYQKLLSIDEGPHTKRPLPVNYSRRSLSCAVKTVSESCCHNVRALLYRGVLLLRCCHGKRRNYYWHLTSQISLYTSWSGQHADDVVLGFLSPAMTIFQNMTAT